MKSFLICLLLIVGENAYPSPNIVDEVYDNSLSNLEGKGYHDSFEDLVRSIIKEGLAKIGPIAKLHNKIYDFPKTQRISGKVNISYLEATGIDAMEIKQLKVNDGHNQIEFIFILPSIHIYSDFLFNLTIAHLIPFYTHKGKANAHFGEVVIKGIADIKPGNPITVSNVQATCTLNQLTVDAHGILDNEDFSYILSAIINVNGQKFINAHPQLLSSTFSQLVELFVNFLLSEGSSVTTTTKSTTTTHTTTTKTTTTTTEPTSSSAEGTTSSAKSVRSSTTGATSKTA